MTRVQDHLDAYTQSWKSSAHTFPSFSHTFPVTEKQRREQVLDRYFRSVNAMKSRAPRRKSLTGDAQQQFITATRHLLYEGLDFTAQQLHVLFSEELLDVSRQFVRQARQFDSALTFNEIFQACRNMWVMNGLQIVLGLPVKLTSSVFAYSLLYPYTDNLIDDPDISADDKARFSTNFHERLAGHSPQPRTSTERIIFSLVDMIEAEYPRSAFPDVYESLLAIHDAQTRSMRLLHAGDSLSESETLEICLAKGGTSVVADGYLVAGTLTKDQEFFLFGYGAYLQLLDDIQDAQEDRAAGLHTVFSRSNEFLESKVNMTHWFSSMVMQNLPLFGSQHLEIFSSLMRKSMELLVIGAIAHTSDLYSAAYVLEMESYSPFSFSYLQTHKEHFVPYNGFLLKAIEELAVAEYSSVTVSPFQQ